MTNVFKLFLERMCVSVKRGMVKRTERDGANANIERKRTNVQIHRFKWLCTVYSRWATQSHSHTVTVTFELKFPAPFSMSDYIYIYCIVCVSATRLEKVSQFSWIQISFCLCAHFRRLRSQIWKTLVDVEYRMRAWIGF